MRRSGYWEWILRSRFSPLSNTRPSLAPTTRASPNRAAGRRGWPHSQFGKVRTDEAGKPTTMTGTLQDNTARVEDDLILDVTLDLTIASGVALNELFSNVLKFAVPDGNGEGNDKLKLEFADNGVGVPDGFLTHKTRRAALGSMWPEFAPCRIAP